MSIHVQSVWVGEAAVCNTDAGGNRGRRVTGSAGAAGVRVGPLS